MNAAAAGPSFAFCNDLSLHLSQASCFLLILMQAVLAFILEKDKSLRRSLKHF